MVIPHYLAMTAAEIAGTSPLPQNCAWMACHFSSYSTGLSNIPKTLPEGSLLILNDRTPIHGHDPERIAWELKNAAAALKCSGLLLDFQDRENAALRELTVHLTASLDFPIGVPAEYRQDNTAVFLPPVPVSTPAEEYLAPWTDVQVWLELSLEGQHIQLTRSGAEITPGSQQEGDCFSDSSLHCHYRITDTQDCVQFDLWRTREDLEALLSSSGAVLGVGLFQELGAVFH